MPSLIVDSMENVALWRALAPDGVTPSTELSLRADSSRARPGTSSAGLIAGTTNALNHTLRRNFAGLDLRGFDELRLWLYSDTAADGTPAHPFFLEMRMASAALALNDPGNKWQRYLPILQTQTWESVRLNIGDLAGAVRNAVTVMQLRCANASAAFACDISDIIAVRDAMIGDVDIALLALLNNKIVLNGAPVPAVLHQAEGPLGQGRPYFEITQYDLVFSRERTQTARPRGDFTDLGYSIRPPSNAYELYYQVTAVADDRATQTQMLEFMLRALPLRGELVVNNFPLPMETVEVEPEDQIGGFRTDSIPVFYRISTRQEVGAGELVLAARTVIVDGDLRAAR